MKNLAYKLVLLFLLFYTGPA